MPEVKENTIFDEAKKFVENGRKMGLETGQWIQNHQMESIVVGAAIAAVTFTIGYFVGRFTK